MYKYIKNYPRNRENGWSHELNGVCHDDNNWFFTQNGVPGREIGVLWKFPITHRLGNKVTCANLEEGILRCTLPQPRGKTIPYHFGDIDYHRGYLFVPVTGDGAPYIQVFSARNLRPVVKQVLLRPDGKVFKTIGWCAINPKDGRLYTSDKHVSDRFVKSDYSPFFVYDIDFAKISREEIGFLSFKTYLVPMNEKRELLSLEHMQGGCFDMDNHLHVNNGYYTGVREKWCNDRGGISVFQVPNTLSNGIPFYIRRIAHSQQKRGFRYQFDGLGDEPEGLTHWDLNRDRRAPGICGVLHAIMLNNDVGKNPDDFYFKHYDRL